MWLCMGEYSAPWRREKDMPSPGTGITDGYELPSATGNWTWVLCRIRHLLTADPSLHLQRRLLYWIYCFVHAELWYPTLILRTWIIFPLCGNNYGIRIYDYQAFCWLILCLALGTCRANKHCNIFCECRNKNRFRLWKQFILAQNI